MRITEFATNLFVKFAPVSPQTVSDLNVQLSDYYSKYLTSFKNKEMENQELAEKAKKLNSKIADPATPESEKDALLFDMTQTMERMQKTTILENVVNWLDKPIVRVLLLVSFAFVARYLAKKLTTPEPEKEDEELEVYPANGGNFKGQQPYYGAPPFYPPYGGYGYPPQQPYQQGKH